MQSLTHSEFSLPGSVWVCKSVSSFAKNKPVERAERGLEPVPSGSPLEHSRWVAGGRGALSSWGREAALRFVYYLLDKGFARRMGIFKAICFGHVLWDAKEIESSPRGREPLPHRSVPSREPQRKDGDWRAQSWGSQSLGPLYFTV